MRHLFFALILALGIAIPFASAKPAPTPDPYSHDFLYAITANPASGTAYPRPPALSTELEDHACVEAAASPAVRGALVKLDAKGLNTDWFAAIDTLEHEKAVWSLQVALCHLSSDVQIHALRALTRLKDQRAVQFLLIYGDYVAVPLKGSESATILGIIHTSIAQALSAITGTEIILKGQDPEGLKKALRQWTLWQVNHSG